MRRRIVYLFLVFWGALLVAGAVFRPWFISEYLRSGRRFEHPTIVELHVLQGFLVHMLQGSLLLIGIVVGLYGILGSMNNTIVNKVNARVTLQHLVLAIVGFLMVATSLPFIRYDVIRIRYATPINRREAWNFVHVSRILKGQPLYLPVTHLPIIPVNYPPLSFLVIGALSKATGDPLRTGRVVSLLSLFTAAGIVYGIGRNVADRRGALLAALLWITLMVRWEGEFVGSGDPQLLGHVAALAGLYVYTMRSARGLTGARIGWVSGLCCLAIFIKPLLIAVPAAIGLHLVFSNRRAFLVFALHMCVVSSLLLLGSWLYGGRELFTNFIEFDRSKPSLLAVVQAMPGKLFSDWFAASLFAPIVVLAISWRNTWLICLTYAGTSLLVGAFGQVLPGVSHNVWYDFFAAAAILFGAAASRAAEARGVWIRPVVYLVMAIVLGPLFLHPKAFPDAFYIEPLREQETSYLESVRLLRSIPGPALFEQPLLGFDAGKEFLFDPFAGSVMMVSRRVPERLIIDPIRAQYFGAIVLYSDSQFQLTHMIDQISPSRSDFPPHADHSWTDSTLRAIKDRYRPLDGSLHDPYFFYIPAR